jgi:LuxR family maltose regulon positive regulatory protein
MAQQGTGNFDRALKTIQNTINYNSLSTPIINTKMLMGLCVIHWLEGKIPEIKLPALQLLRIGEEAKLSVSISFGRYFLGSYHYIRNELVEAETHFKAVVENRYLAREHYHAHCVFGLALCEIAQNRIDQARQVVESLLEYVLETGNTWLFEITQAFQAELDLRLNQIVESYIWGKVADPNFVAPMYVFYMPKLSAARAMLTIDTPQSRKDATDLLDHLHDIAVSTHNRRVQIDVLALQALLHNTQDVEKIALAKLRESLALAEPGGFIRNYVDMGPQMATLLSQLHRQVEEGQSPLPYIARILSTFPKADQAIPPGELTSIGSADLPSQTGLSEPLTKRELQILKYLATDLSAQEIAAEIYVATATVRTHTKNIYSKLNVHSRLQAVQRAKDLDLL